MRRESAPDAAAAALARLSSQADKRDARADPSVLADRPSASLPRLNPEAGQVRALAAPVVASPATVNIHEQIRVKRPDSWRFAMAPRADRDPRHPRFSRVRPDSLVCPTEKSIDAWLDAALHAKDVISKSVPEQWGPLEDGALKKLTVQRGTLISWFVSKTAPGESDLVLPPRFHSALRMVVNAFDRAWRRFGDAPYSPEPADTNSGYPLFVAHPAAKIVGAACGPSPVAASVAAFERAASRAATLTSTPFEAAFGYGLGGRSGPFYKWQPDLLPVGDGTWKATREMRGHTQRNRVVQMSPLPINLALGPLFRRLKGARRYLPGLWRDGVSDHLLHAPYKYTYEADISGFDASVTRQLQLAVADELKRVWPDLSDVIDVWLWAEARPLITPDWALDPGYCAVSFSTGGTKSGLKLTSEMGTLYSAAAALYALLAQGKAADWPTQKGLSLSVQGDDVLVGSDAELDVAQWAASYSEVGLTAELMPGDGFLARHNGKAHLPPVPAVGRCIQQTLSNEHEPTGPDCDGILLLGTYARTAGSSLWPAAAAKAAWDCIMQSPFYAQFGHATLADFRRWVRSSDDAATMINKSIAAAASEPWITSVFRDAEHSPVAASIAARLEAAGYSRLSTSLDAAVDKITSAIANLDESAKAGIIAEGMSALRNGTTSADHWVQNLLLTFTSSNGR